MEQAMNDEDFSGEGIKKAMYKKPNWVPKGLDGVCLPSTWKEDDHRGLMDVPIYKVKVNGSTEKLNVDELMSKSIIRAGTDFWIPSDCCCATMAKFHK